MCVFYPRKNIQRDAVRIAQRKEWNVILEEFEDIEPDNVTLLIRHSSDNYIVFIDGDSEVDYETTDAYDEAHPSHEVRLSTIYNRIEDLEHRPAVQYLSAKNQKALVRLLGNALAAELDMAQSEADKAIQMAEQFLKQRTIEISRRWLLLSAFGRCRDLIWRYGTGSCQKIFCSLVVLGRFSPSSVKPASWTTTAKQACS